MARTTTTSRKSEGSDKLTGSVAAMDLLLKKRKAALPHVLVIAGEAAFLRRQVLQRVREAVLGDELNDFTYSVHSGESIRARDVFDELWTAPLIGERRLVVVQPAERKQRRRAEESASERTEEATDEEASTDQPTEQGDFVSQNRPALENYVAHPSSFAVLVLDLRSLPANTRLYKAVQQSGLIVECAPSKAHNMAGWCRQWATYRYGKELSKDAADWLLELAGPEYGVLDQELQKLSTFVGDAGAIGFEVVQRLTAGAGDDKAFKILDAALDGNCAEALVLLERQLAAGDPPQRLLNIASSQVRKLTRAARMAVAKSHSLPQALAAAGVPPFAIERSAARLKRLGRERMAEMFRRLLAADLAVKGGSGLDASTVLTRFVRDLAEGGPQTPAPVPQRSRY